MGDALNALVVVRMTMIMVMGIRVLSHVARKGGIGVVIDQHEAQRNKCQEEGVAEKISACSLTFIY